MTHETIRDGLALVLRAFWRRISRRGIAVTASALCLILTLPDHRGIISVREVAVTVHILARARRSVEGRYARCADRHGQRDRIFYVHRRMTRGFNDVKRIIE